MSRESMREVDLKWTYRSKEARKIKVERELLKLIGGDHTDQYIIERALFFDLQELVRGGFRETSPLLSINLHNYEETNSTCPEMKEHCSICLEKYSDREELARIDCGHIYHIDCLRELNMIKNNCPICKRKVVVLCHFPLSIRAFLRRLRA